MAPSRRPAAQGDLAAAAAAAAAESQKCRDMERAIATPPRAPLVENRYDKLKLIGSGSYGAVYRALDRRTGETVAMKCLSTAKFDESRLDLIFSCELGALEACRGLPFVVQLRDARRRDPDSDEAFIVMEFVGPSLADVMMNDADSGKWQHPEHEVRRLVRQLLAGVAGMHRVGIMHRDIKPANVLVDSRGDLKLCDLGISRAFSDVPPYTNPVMARKYRAPELLLGSTDYDSLIDSWATGCIMTELLAGWIPFHGDTIEEQLREVLNVLGTDDIKEWSRCPDRLPGGRGPTSFLRDMFPSPELDATMTYGRPTLSDAGFEVLSGLLRCNPDKRISAGCALKHRWFEEN